MTPWLLLWASWLQVNQFAAFLGACGCARCGSPLRYAAGKSLQIGVAAQWAAVCTNSKCHALPLLLRTSESEYAPFDDDFKLNRRTHFAAIASAVNHTRLNDMVVAIGLGELSVRGHWLTKEQVEAPAAHRAQAKMAAAYECELQRPPSAVPRCALIDGAWDHGRNGSVATVPFFTESGHIIHIENARKTEKGVKSANALEMLAYKKGLANPRIASPIFAAVAMDGCRPLIAATEAALKQAEGEQWHHGKARFKGFNGHCDAYVIRPKPTALELEAKEAAKHKVAKPKVRASPPSRLSYLSEP